MNTMKKQLILFTLMVASLALYAQDKTSAVSVDTPTTEIKGFDYGDPTRDSIENISNALLHEYALAEAMQKKGIVLKNVGWILFAATPVYMAGAYIGHGGTITTFDWVLGGATFLAASVMIPTGYVYKGTGTWKMKFLTEQLNKLDYSEAFSIRLTPTLMSCPQSSSLEDIGIGLSISVGF